VEAVALFGIALSRNRDDQHGLGTQILKGFADQIHGTLAITLDHGTTVTVDFPTVSA
jgi:two-component sensor histidine kinase